MEKVPGAIAARTESFEGHSQAPVPTNRHREVGILAHRISGN